MFNLSPFERSEVVSAYIWDRGIPGNQLVVKNDAGESLPVQVPRLRSEHAAQGALELLRRRRPRLDPAHLLRPACKIFLRDAEQ